MDYLGVVLDSRLTWRHHVQKTRDKFLRARNSLFPLLGRRSPVPLKGKMVIYTSILRPILTYAALAWVTAANTHKKTFATLQNGTLRTITGAPWFVRNDQLHNDLQIPRMTDHLLHLARAMWGRAATSEHPIVRHLVELDSDRSPPPLRVRRVADAVRLEDWRPLVDAISHR